MAGAKIVVLTLCSLEKTADAFVLSNRLEFCFAAGQNLVNVTLMPNIPNEFVHRRLKNMVQGNGQLDDAQAGRKMPANAGDHFDKIVADFATKLFKVGNR